MTAVRLALRLGRWGLLGFAGVGFIATFINAVGFYAVAGHTQAEREAFARDFEQIAAQVTVLLPPPVRLDTMGGYTQYRAYGSLIIVFAIWALASAAGAVRGDEDRGLTEMILAGGLSRARAIAARIAAFALACFAAALAASLGLIVKRGHRRRIVSDRCRLTGGRPGRGIHPELLFAGAPGRAARRSQIRHRYLGRDAPRAFSGQQPQPHVRLPSTVRWLSPFRYYELSHPLTPGGNFDVRATLVLARSPSLRAPWQPSPSYTATSDRH